MPKASAARKNKEDLPELVYVDRSFPTAKIIELRNKNLTYTEIAKIAGVSKQAIQQRIRPYAHSITHLDAIRDQRVSLLELITNNMLEVYLSLTPGEQKDMIFRRGLLDFGKLYDKLRLETGQSTTNVAYMDLIRARQQLQGELQAIENE